MMNCGFCLHEVGLSENITKPSRTEEVFIKVRPVVKMAKRALDQVAWTTLEKSSHRQCKSNYDNGHGEKGKPTNVIKNHKWPYKAHDNEGSPELVWQRVRWPKSRTSVRPSHCFSRNNIRGIGAGEENNFRKEKEEPFMKWLTPSQKRNFRRRKIVRVEKEKH